MNIILLIIGAVIGGGVTMLVIWGQQFCGTAKNKAVEEEQERLRREERRAKLAIH